jgi:hypothetical protein
MDNATSLQRRPAQPTLLALALAGLGALTAGCGAAPVETGSAGPDLSQAGQGTNLIVTAGAPGVAVQVFLNHSPLIAGLGGSQEFLLDTAGQAVVHAELSVTATDEDGDDLTYLWTSPNCPAALIAFPAPADPTRIDFTGDAAAACQVQVEVLDQWKGGLAPAGSGLPVAKGGSAIGRLQLAPPPVVTTGGKG